MVLFQYGASSITSFGMPRLIERHIVRVSRRAGRRQRRKTFSEKCWRLHINTEARRGLRLCVDMIWV